MPAIGEEKTGFPQGPVLVDASYPGKLKDCKEYDRTDKNGDKYTNIAWIFGVKATEDDIDEDVEYDEEEFPFTGEFEVVAHTGQNRSNYATSRWAQINLDQIVPEDATSTDDAIGAVCTVTVTSYVGNDGQTHNKVTRLSKPKKNQKAGTKRVKTPAQRLRDDEVEEVDESDFDDIPFGD